MQIAGHRTPCTARATGPPFNRKEHSRGKAPPLSCAAVPGWTDTIPREAAVAQLVLVALAMSGLLFLLMLVLLAGDRALTRRRTLHAPAAKAAARAVTPDDTPPDAKPTSPAPIHAAAPPPAPVDAAESMPRRGDSGLLIRPDSDYLARVEAAVAALYGAAGVKAPRVAVAPSPLSMLIAHGLVAALVRMHEYAKVPEPLAPGLPQRKAAGEAVWLAGTRPASADGSRGWRVMEDERSTAMQAAGVTRIGWLHLGEHLRLALRELLQQLTRGGAGEQRDAPALPIYGAAAAVALHAVYGHMPSSVAAMTLHDAVAWVAAAAGADARHLGNVVGVCLQEMAELNNWRSQEDGTFALRRGLGLPCTTWPQRDEFKDPGAWAGHVTDLIAHGEFCIAGARPDAVHVDEAGRLHCVDGPSVRWPDGWSLYHWHGVRLPHDYEFIVTQPQLITVQHIETMSNLEVRRAMLDIYGASRFVVDSGALVVNALPQDHPIAGLRGARLFRKQLAFDTEPLVFVELVNSTPEPDGTCRRYMLRVDPRAYGGLAEYLCHAAAASTWRRADGRLAYADFADYRPAAES
jgi:hypothetical protein